MSARRNVLEGLAGGALLILTAWLLFALAAVA